jgi:hypothetical protein
MTLKGVFSIPNPSAVWFLCCVICVWLRGVSLLRHAICACSRV